MPWVFLRSTGNATLHYDGPKLGRKPIAFPQPWEDKDLMGSIKKISQDYRAGSIGKVLATEA